jgi:OOP family OmpA-OmpF porin
MILGACGTSQVDRLANSPKSGQDYNDRLARNYAEYARFEEKRMYDEIDAVYFAEKGMAALHGENVQPEQPEKWSVDDQKMLDELTTNRPRLMAALRKGAAEKMPAATARAMVSYDCWVEQAEEGWQYDDIAGCRQGFMRAMARIDDGMKPQTAMAEEKTVVVVPKSEPEPQPAPPADYIVFFGWDSAKLTDSARTVLNTVAQQARESGIRTFQVIGHADRSGPAAYNRTLSLRRADAVTAVLIRNGFRRDDIVTLAKGESDPLIETGDGVREPQNRRVKILLLDKAMGS